MGKVVRPPLEPGNGRNETHPPQPTWRPTLILLLGLTLTSILLRGETALEIARSGAIGAAISITASVLFEAAYSRANLFRTDVVMIVAFFGLTFLEFLFPQPIFDQEVADERTIYVGVQACLLALAALAIGRHVSNSHAKPWGFAGARMPPNKFLALFWISFLVGFFYMMLAVSFNPVALIHYFLQPRFTQPWTRGKYGDWKALLTEIGAVIYLVPPIGGIVLGELPGSSLRFATLTQRRGSLWAMFPSIERRVANEETIPDCSGPRDPTSTAVG